MPKPDPHFPYAGIELEEQTCQRFLVCDPSSRRPPRVSLLPRQENPAPEHSRWPVRCSALGYGYRSRLRCVVLSLDVEVQAPVKPPTNPTAVASYQPEPRPVYQIFILPSEMRFRLPEKCTGHLRVLMYCLKAANAICSNLFCFRALAGKTFSGTLGRHRRNTSP